MKIRLKIDFYDNTEIFYESWQVFDTKSYFLKLPFISFELKVTRKKRKRGL